MFIEKESQMITARSARGNKASGNRLATDLVWAAACAAQRVNGEYVKVDQVIWDEGSQTSRVTKRRNRDVMAEFLINPDQITEADREQGRAVQAFVRNDITFRALKGRLTDFDQAVSRVLAVESEFDTVQHRYELAIVASLPASQARSEKRATADERVKFAGGGLIGSVGDKIQTQVEVISSVYSQNYGCWFVRGITDQDQPVFFSQREGQTAGTWLTIRGSVKAHRDNLTQLTRVKVL